MTIDKAVIRAVAFAAPLAALAPAPLFATGLAVGSDRDALQLAQLTERERRQEIERREAQRRRQQQQQRQQQEQREQNENLLNTIQQRPSPQGQGQQEQQQRNSAAGDPRFDPEAGYSPEILEKLVNRARLNPLSPEQVAQFAGTTGGHTGPGDHLSSDPPPSEDSGLTEDELLEDLIGQIERDQDDGWARFASDFPLVASGQVSPMPPTASLSGGLMASYEGRFAGAFGDGTEVGGTMGMTVDFDSRTLAGGMLFDGARYPAIIEGGWADGANAVTGAISGQGIIGDYIEGEIDGAFYGPGGEELGGTWSAEVLTNGQLEHSLGGRFAVGQQP